MKAPPAPSFGHELLFIMLAAWVAFVSIPLTVGMGLSWDALNHHLYLGWIADSPRFDKDFMAASYQSFQYPYLYWPFYKLASLGAGPSLTGAVLDSLYVAAVPPLWMLARRFVADAGWWGMAMRTCAVALSFASGLVLSMFDSTANDLLAALPLVWAIALTVEAVSRDGADPRTRRDIVLAGAFAGLAVAFKISNGLLVLVLPVGWLACTGSWRSRAVATAAGCVAILATFALAYGYWGSQLWSHYGNPVYPFADDWFALLRSANHRP